jgi:hypothetical protein
MHAGSFFPILEVDLNDLVPKTSNLFQYLNKDAGKQIGPYSTLTTRAMLL